MNNIRSAVSRGQLKNLLNSNEVRVLMLQNIGHKQLGIIIIYHRHIYIIPFRLWLRFNNVHRDSFEQKSCWSLDELPSEIVLSAFTRATSFKIIAEKFYLFF